MNNRHTLTKSLHTVTAVANVAREILRVAKDADRQYNGSFETLTRGALEILGQRTDWNAADPTFAACVAAVVRAVQS